MLDEIDEESLLENQRERSPFENHQVPPYMVDARSTADAHLP